MDIYLAILENPNTVVRIAPFTRVISALKRVTEWQLDYADEVWGEEEIAGCEYYVRSGRYDGPFMRIEKHELQGALPGKEKK